MNGLAATPVSRRFVFQHCGARFRSAQNRSSAGASFMAPTFTGFLQNEKTRPALAHATEPVIRKDLARFDDPQRGAVRKKAKGVTACAPA
jgi:hypothetical protein